MRSIYDNVLVGSIAAGFATVGFTITTGASFDTRGFNTAVLRVFTAPFPASAAAGNGASLTAVLQESNDALTWTTATDNTGATIGGAQESTTTAVISSYRIEGLGLQRKRYLRVQTTARFGSPTLSTYAFTHAAVIEAGRSYNKPVTSTVSNT